MESNLEAKIVPETKSKNRIALLAILLALVAIITSLLLYKELKTDAHAIQENQIRLAKGLLGFNQSLQSMQEQLQIQTNKINVTEEMLQRLSQMVGPVENGVLLQAEYLTQLAQLALTYQGDISGALSLLKMADQRLSTLSIPAMVQVREVLAKAITALQAIPAIDLSGVLAKLDALSEQVTQLPLVPELPHVQPVLKQPAKFTKLDTYLTDWKDALNTSWHALERVIIIRHHGQPIEPLLAPDEYLYLKQNIQLQLQQAQWAALHQQQAIYVLSLQRAASWVNHYFTDNGLLSRAVQQNLVELQKIKIQPALPDIVPVVNKIQQAQQIIFVASKTAPKIGVTA